MIKAEFKTLYLLQIESVLLFIPRLKFLVNRKTTEWNLIDDSVLLFVVFEIKIITKLP